MQQFEFELFADYFQFYLQDEDAAGDLSDSWGPDAVSRLLALAPGTVGVGTVRNTIVTVFVEIHAATPSNDESEWDHVVECGLDVPTGKIVIAGCTDYFPDASRIVVAPGQYRVLVSYGRLNSLSQDGLTGEDSYRIQLWPGHCIEPRIAKQRDVA